MSKITELRKKCDALYGEIEQFRAKAKDKSQDFSAEDEVNFQRVCDDYDAAKAAHDDEFRAAQESAATRERLLARADETQRAREQDIEQRRRIGRDDFRGAASGRDDEITEAHRGLSLRAWYFSDKRSLTSEEEDACRRVGVDPRTSEYNVELCRTEQINEGRARFIDAQRRALSAHIGTSGAFTVQDGFVNSLETALLAWGGMRQVAEIIRTDSGNTIPYSTANDTTNTGELIAESTEVSAADPTFGAVNLYAHKYSSKLVKVPAELLEDSAFNIPTILGGMLGERLGRITNTHFTTGDGAARPRGITTMSTLGKTTASGSAITMNEVLDLIDSVDEAYLIGASFMLKRSTLTLLRKLVDGQGQYLWTRGTQAGEPDLLWGYPYTTNQDMPAATTGLKSMLFGQLSKYKIREVRSIRLRRLVERYAEVDQEGFVAFGRYDGALIDAGTNPVKHMLQA